ncbi:MAG: TnsD family Tn7-like transposition protein [Cyclobacteriaceae bacterium]
MSYWSKPYPDEILYSTIARNICYLGTKGPKQLLKRLFDRTTICSTLDLPSGINHLAKHINIKDQTAENLIDKHTLFKYYTRFIPDNRRRKVWNSMLTKSGDIHTRCGIVTGPFPPLSTPRFCPICLNEQIELSGEPYLKLTHQIPSVNICTKHKILLNQVEFNYESINKHLFIDLYDYQSNLWLKKIIPFFNEETTSLTKRLESLALKPLSSWPYDEPYIYNEKIKQLGFNKGQDSLDWSKIHNEFENFFAKSTLIHFRSEVSFVNPSCWLKAILRKHRKTFDPVRHMLIEAFLEYLKSNQTKPIPSQPKNYACKNPICKNYGKANTTHEIKRDPKSNRDITYVSCSCGYIYTSSYLKDKGHHFIRVRTFGKEWENELLKLINQKLSLRAIAKRLNVDPKTIKTYLKEHPSDEGRKKEISSAKKEWLSLVKANKELSITQIRRIKPAVYSYLYRHDKKWLLSHKYAQAIPTNTNRIEWEKRDRQILIKLQASYNNLKIKFPRKRRSKSLLLRLAKSEVLYNQHMIKLPKCKAFLNHYSESLQKHRKRRLVLAYKALSTKEVPVKKWILLRQAGIRKEYIDFEIETLVNHLLTCGLDTTKNQTSEIA